MMRRLTSVLGLAFAGAATVFTPSTAHAGFADCGNIHVEASAMCSVEVEGGCTAKCTPVSVEASCAAELEVDCSASKCNVDVQGDCMAECDFDGCVAKCNVNPPSFDCKGQCYAEGDADCQGQCKAAGNQGECEASCKAEFSAKCD